MLKKLFGGAFENIKAEKGSFFSSIISFVLIFSLINIFTFGILNLDTYRLKEEEANQAIIYLKELTSEDKHNFQLKLLNLDGVSSVRYISKDVALKTLEKELNVDLSSEPNPLEDSFFIYLNSDVKIDELNNKLLELEEISSLDLRTKVINQTVNFSKNLDSFIKYSAIFLFIFSMIMIYNISVLSVKTRKTEIHINLLKNYSVNFIKTTFFIESLMAIIISSLLSYLLYTSIRGTIIDLIQSALLDKIVFVPLEKELPVLIIIVILAIILSLVINFVSLSRYYNLKYYEKEYNEDKKEIKEAISEKEEEVSIDEEDFEDLGEEI